ncbi:MAG TPA: ABC transporter permease [Pseudonocardiaceae bacterium]
MLVYVVRRVLVSIPLLVAASFLAFALTTAMGDPLGEYRLRVPQPTPAQIAAAEQRIGLDKPFLVRYESWATDFVRGDWGTTVTPGRGTVDVRDAVTRASWVSVRLVLGAELIALVLGVAVGVLSAVRQYSITDHGVTGLAFLMFSMPMFCLALMVKEAGIRFNDLLEAAGLGRWLRTAGPPDGGFEGGFADQVYQYSGTFLMPTLCLVALQFAGYSRYQRAAMFDVLESDYVRTARAKGLSQARVVLLHALRVALLPICTVVTLGLGGLLAGAVITETVFAWPGTGRLLVEAVTYREPFLILALMMVSGVFVIVCNLLADIGYAVLDPRVRLRG